MDNKEIIRQFHHALEEGDQAKAASYWREDAINHASGRSENVPVPQGRDAVQRVFEALHIVFPDRRWTIEEMIAEGDLIVCRMTVSGTFGTVPPPPGPRPDNWLGIESTALVPESARGRPSSVHHVHKFRVRDGLIAEHWAARDDLALLVQLGAVAPPSRTN